MKAEVFTDGATRPINPGPSGFGAVLYLDDEMVYNATGFLGRGTNNVAEYFGLIAGLDLINDALDSYDIEEVTFFLDSLLVIRQVTGEWNITKLNLLRLRDAALERIRQLGLAGVTVTFQHVKGHAGNVGNVEADHLATAAVLQQHKLVSILASLNEEVTVLADN